MITPKIVFPGYVICFIQCWTVFLVPELLKCAHNSSITTSYLGAELLVGRRCTLIAAFPWGVSWIPRPQKCWAPQHTLQVRNTLCSPETWAFSLASWTSTSGGEPMGSSWNRKARGCSVLSWASGMCCSAQLKGWPRHRKRNKTKL